MKHWKTKSSKYLHKDNWISLRADECELPDGRVVVPFYVLEEKEWVHVLAINDVGEILLTRQYRHGAKVVCSELPCGAAEAGETPLEAAKRELREETGYCAATWTSVAALFANPARQSNRIHCFVARNLKLVGPQRLDKTEEIAVEFASQMEVRRRIATGEFSQALHVSSFFLGLELLKKEAEP
jgi:ADP-ribose pyrophosphatase